MNEPQYGTIRIGQIVKLFTYSIGFDALLESVPNKEKTSVKKMIQRLGNEDGIRIDMLRQFEQLLKTFCKWAMDNNFMNQTHNYIVQTLYYDMLALITKTSPYNTPTQNEVELQVMYCIALTFREIYDNFEKKERKDWGYTLQLTLFASDFWKRTNYMQNVSLIPACFDFIFSEIKNPKTDLFNYWEELKDSQEKSKKKTKTNYAKSINDWVEKAVAPSWKIIKTIFASPTPETIEFKESNSNYFVFKTHLFLAYFFSNFFKSLEEQKLVSSNFKTTVQNGLHWFYRYVFVVKDFRQYQVQEVQNPMFSIMRFLVLPTNKSKNLISEYICEAFDKENPNSQSLYFIPTEKIYYPFLSHTEMDTNFKIYQIIFETFNELSTNKEFGIFTNKIIKEEEIDAILNWPIMGVCKQFFYNWFKGKYHVLCHDLEGGLKYYRKAFEHRYFGGKALPVFLQEFIVLIQKCNCRKTEFNKIHEWANAVRIYIQEIDKGKTEHFVLKNSFDEVFPEETFIK